MYPLLAAILLFFGLWPPFAFPQAQLVTPAPLSTATRLVVKPSSRVVAQGDVLVIRARAGADETLVARLGDLLVIFAPDRLEGAGYFVARVKIDQSLPVGDYMLSVSAATAAASDLEYCDNTTTSQTAITVRAGK